MSNIPWPNWHDHHEQVIHVAVADKQYAERILTITSEKLRLCEAELRRTHRALTKLQQRVALARKTQDFSNL